MAIPKEPAELEARLLKAGEVMRQAAHTLSEISIPARSATIDLVRRVLQRTADEVLS